MASAKLATDDDDGDGDDDDDDDDDAFNTSLIVTLVGNIIAD